MSGNQSDGAGVTAGAPKGECYKRAYEFVNALRKQQVQGTEPVLKDAKLLLVHGTVVTQAKSIAGKRIDHAWVEIHWPQRCQVFEFANEVPEAEEKTIWVKKLQAVEETRYTPEEAVARAFSLNPPHYGPWHK